MVFSAHITGKNGNKIANQFIITDTTIDIHGYGILLDCDAFQSYNSIIVVKDLTDRIFLDEKYWDYSVTTGKYRNMFLGETKKETQKKIDSGEYILCNLN